MADEVLIGGVEKVEIRVVDYDAAWPARFEEHASRICEALGDAALVIEHIGSTSVPGLPAKPIVDVLLVVSDSNDETSYLPHLERRGYELRVREPAAEGHRMLRTPRRDVHVHVYSLGAEEIERCLSFRNRLRGSAQDRELYARTKRELAARDWSDMNAYASAKNPVIQEILRRGRRP